MNTPTAFFWASIAWVILGGLTMGYCLHELKWKPMVAVIVVWAVLLSCHIGGFLP